MPPVQKKRNFIFTINNYTEQTKDVLSNVECLYICYKPEIGESGTRHIQGLVCFRGPTTIRSCCTKLGGSAHVEFMRGTIDQAYEYVAKEETTDTSDPTFGLTERGIRPAGAGLGQGSRTDLGELLVSIQSGKRAADILQLHTPEFFKYSKGIMLAISLSRGTRDFKTEVFWYYGPTGTGKSREAYELTNDPYTKMGGNKWWDGYDAHGDVIIDDYRRDLCTFSELLRLFDRYPMLVETKGASVPFLAHRIFITTPKSPRETWEGRCEEDLDQLTRRITQIKHFSNLAAAL
jgi:hypothetical protein